MLNFSKKIILIFLILITFFSITNIIFAQQIIPSMSSVELNIFPISPRAGDSIVLTLSSNLLDLYSSKIIWYIDGTARKETSNKSITIKAKSDGQKTLIRVVVETSDGIVKEISKEISPAGVDLIIEPISYTLPFYEGKPYLISQGMVKIIALPDIIIDGKKMSSENLNFKWSKGENILGANSGKGQNSIIVNSTIPIRDITIGVEVSDDSGNILAQNSKLLILNNPKILFYENSPLYGILYNKAITGNYYLGTKEELTITAKPFSFNFLNDISEGSDYKWFVNENYIIQNGKANEIILKQKATNLKGTASVSVIVKNINKINQFANEGFGVEFGQ
ncbi:MAG: hypothetical protein V1910_02560 [bacterium]